MTRRRLMAIMTSNRCTRGNMDRQVMSTFQIEAVSHATCEVQNSY
jgi:hypothetical protein